PGRAAGVGTGDPGARPGRRVRPVDRGRPLDGGRVRRYARERRGPGRAAGRRDRPALPGGLRLPADDALRGLGRLPAALRPGRGTRVRPARTVAVRLAPVGARDRAGGPAVGPVRRRLPAGPPAVLLVRLVPRL